ncbi:hypothetical protein M501DRAFT_1000993 [Patellaria atrata CBS 101060]|uniref:Uncharacterized protein n=1 Tax=Patellaria atrata CBS 101060 TaxID=1346257 RepID=A0A9P4SG57_9PEZI|nr:hypothetical protein M501DRAFT_1000993 [Patellaria atrata CBS 101060]
MAPRDEISNKDAFDLALRKLNIYTFIPAFALNFAHVGVAHKAFPAIGLVPQLFSTLLSFIILHHHTVMARHASHSGVGGKVSKPKSALLAGSIFAADLIIGLSILTCLFFAWFVGLKRGYYWSEDHNLILGTYATMPLLVNFIVHTIFTLRTLATFLPLRLFSFSNFTGTCPHCSRSLDSPTLEPRSKYHGDKTAGAYFLLGQETSIEGGEMSGASAEDARPLRDSVEVRERVDAAGTPEVSPVRSSSKDVLEVV